MKQIVIVLILTGILVQVTEAGVIVSTGVNPHLISAGTVSHAPLLLNVASNNSDVMLGWQIPLLILPDVGAVGSMSFHTALAPSAGYIFNSPGNFFNASISTVSSHADMLFASDLDFRNGALGAGAVIPEPSDVSLLEIAFSATADAEGTFGLFALNDSTVIAEWTDANQMARGFANVAVTGMTRIGEVRTVIPEPSSCLLLFSLFIVSCGAGRDFLDLQRGISAT